MNRGHVEDVYELSPLQQGMLLHSLYGGDPDTYVAQHSHEIYGQLDPAALRQAWQRTVDAHTALRTSFHWEGLDKPLQVVHRDVPVAMARHDWSELAEPQYRERFRRLLADERRAGFDPARVPLLRLQLVRLGEQRHAFAWTHHQLPVDGWSVPIILNDVVGHYRSLTTGAPPPVPATPYRDYIAWLQRQDLAAAKDFWVAALTGGAGPSPLGPLLPDRPEPHATPVDERVVDLPAGLTAALRTVATRHRVTLNTVLLAGWALVLQRFSGGAEVRLGLASSGRPPELPGVDRIAGNFVNTLPVQLAVPDDGDLGGWLREIQDRHATARRYEYAPLAQIKVWAGVPGPQPLFDSVVVVENHPLAIEGGELVEQLSIRSVSEFEKTSEPLTLSVRPEPVPSASLRFHRERFPPGAVDEILAELLAVLAATGGADRVGTLAAATRPPGGDGSGAAVRYPDAGQTLPGLIERQARASPDAVAVAAEEGVLTYRELLGRARQTAAALAAAGAGPGSVVGVCGERSPDLVAGLLGVLLAGAAYLPLEPSLPAARLAFQAGDAGAGLVLAPQAAAATAPAAGARQVLVLDDLPAAPAGWAPPAVSGADAAYVIYTSGSTGRPKGVVITHAAIVNRLLWMQEAFPQAAGDRVLQKTPLGFDVSVWELFWPLLTGATLVLARPGGHQDAEYLARTIVAQQVTTAHFVPSMLQLFLDEPAAAHLPALRRVICSGEQLPEPLARRFRQLLPGVELHNLYGPTEAAVDVTWWDCARPGPPGVVPIGDPIANTQAYVLDRRLREAPRHVPGELYLGGVQLARGYLNRPGLTAATFVAHPLAGPGGRLYRTGDRVRRLSGGSLEFLGRLDHQVKILGYRIELGEIEQVLAGHPAVREAAVVVRHRGDVPQLAAYLTAAPAQQPDPAALREFLQLRLPRYLLPATYTVLPAMPLSHNGKLDRAALPDPAVPAPRPRVAPATPQEEAVAAVFREVLGVAEVDVTASFFELGGTSFDAVRAIRRIEGATVGLLAAYPSVRALIATLGSAAGPPGVLLRLTEPAAPSATLVFVPFGGGSAIAYRPLTGALPADMALHAVTLPGHEPGGEPHLRPLEEVAQECTQAVLDLGGGPVCVYGHCAGVALAVELVRRLEAAGRPVQRLFVAGSFPFYQAGPVGRALQRALAVLVGRGILPVSARTVGTTGNHQRGADLAELRYLQSIGGFANAVDEETLAFVLRAFRHDVAEGSRYFSRRWSRRRAPDPAPPLAAPITFIVGTDDPLTHGYQRGARMWQRFSPVVELATVAGGGHYFLQHQPEALAGIIKDTMAAGGRDPVRVLAPPAAPGGR